MSAVTQILNKAANFWTRPFLGFGYTTSAERRAITQGLAEVTRRQHQPQHTQYFGAIAKALGSPYAIGLGHLAPMHSARHSSRPGSKVW